ncbi:MAG: T9SS type A sorting domain-containing protein [Fidelibacterota bacterium]
MKAKLTVSTLLCWSFASISPAQDNWTKYAGNPVLQRGEYPEWNCFAVADPTVINDNDTLKMWYSGAGYLGADTVARVRFGYAWSVDGGVNWTQYTDNPVMDVGEAGEWDGMSIETPCVIKDGDTLKMWYMGYHSNSDFFDYLGSIGYAWSLDGITWTKYPDNPVLTEGIEPWGDWIYYALESPSVIKENGVYNMWFGAAMFDKSWNPNSEMIAIAFATSPDGINWSFDILSNPVFIRDTFAVWDSGGVEDPEIIKLEDQYVMYYTGTDAKAEWENPQTHFQTGLARSVNGINWVRDIHNPILPVGSAGEWDRFQAADVAVVSIEDTLRMFYTGIDTATQIWPDYYYDVGYAWITIDTGTVETQEEEPFIPGDIRLSPNYPNPFNVITVIDYQILQSGWITLQIFNVSGRAVKTLVNEYKTAGRYTVTWNGKNDPGNASGSGIYFYQLKSKNSMRIKKLILLR